MESQPGKLVAAIMLLVVAAGVFFYMTRDPAALPNRFNFICVETGETFNIAKSDLRSIPARNPKTEKYTLLPVMEEDGRMIIDEHYRGSVVGDLKEINKFVDPKTLEVKNVN